MKSAAGIVGLALAEHEWTARHGRVYANVRRFGGLSSKLAGLFFNPETRNPQSMGKRLAPNECAPRPEASSNMSATRNQFSLTLEASSWRRGKKRNSYR